MVAALVETVEVAARARRLAGGARAKPFVEDAVAQRLRRVDVGVAFGEPDLQRAGRR